MEEKTGKVISIDSLEGMQFRAHLNLTLTRRQTARLRKIEKAWMDACPESEGKSIMTDQLFLALLLQQEGAGMIETILGKYEGIFGTGSAPGENPGAPLPDPRDGEKG